MTKYLLIAAGGLFGSMLRYALQGWGQRWAGGGFPTDTLAVNNCDCFVLGALSAAFAGPPLVREEYRIGLTKAERAELDPLRPRNCFSGQLRLAAFGCPCRWQ